MRTDRAGPKGDVQKARRLCRAAWQDGQSSRRRATQPASLLDIMPPMQNQSDHPTEPPMRHSLTLLAASLMLATGSICAKDAPTTIPASVVQTAEQLRDKALHDDTAYKVVEGLTTEV